MHAKRFDRLVTSVSPAGSRRTLLHVLSTRSLVGVVMLRGDEAHAAEPEHTNNGHVGGENHGHRGRRRNHLNRQKRKNQRHRKKRNDWSPSLFDPVASSPVLTYQCGPSEGTFSDGDSETARYAQTFTAIQRGSLHQIQIEVNELVPDSTGDYLVELLAVGDDRKPTNTVLASATVPGLSVPDGPSTLTASFSGPPLSAETEYAAALSRPGGSLLMAEWRTGNDCTGTGFWQETSGSGTFNELAISGS